ncbi:MAG TPA: YbfB/YjiJ family MFS transporter, partial [Acidiferrobacteraceae bacterium]|nr:YbfB/YjiJ family MFS transporter [Acidiferrobacteraceae bacterium]
GLFGLTASGILVPMTRPFEDPASALGPHHGLLVSVRGLAPTLVSYAFFGAGYIVYMTFIVVYLAHQGVGAVGIAGFWTVLGMSAAASGWAWRGVLGHCRKGRGVALANTGVLGGVLAALSSHQALAVLISAVLFGGSFLAVVTAVTAVARRNLDAHHWTGGVGALTAAFGVGQTLGPFLAAGTLRASHGIHRGLLFAALLLGLSVSSALLQRDAGVPSTGSATRPR